MNKVAVAIQRKPLLFAAGALLLILVTVLVMRHRQTQAISAVEAQDTTQPAPTGPAYFTGSDGLSSALSDASGVGDAGDDGSISSGSFEQGNLSPTMDSSAGVDVTNPVTNTGGGVPATPSTSVHQGVISTTVVDPNGNVHQVVTAAPVATPTKDKQKHKQNSQGLGIKQTGPFRTSGSAHPDKSNAPARRTGLHSAGLITKPHAPKPRKKSGK